MSSTLTQAAADGGVVEMRRIIASGETVNATRGDGATPLLLAALGAHAEACRVLLDAGAEVNTSLEGRTALDWATLRSHDDVAQALRQGRGDEMRD